jgi:large subunit ribosomal protein L4
MIEIPVHNLEGKQVDAIQIDERMLGDEVRPALLKQAYVRQHANRRQGSAKTKNRSETAFSTRKLYKQKGTGNARRGSAGTNLMRKGGHGFAKRPRSWRLEMPHKMRKLANRNALLAKAVDQEIKVVDTLSFEKPNTKAFASVLKALSIDRSCLVALTDTRTHEARSARNLPAVHVTPVTNLNAYDLLSHRYLLVERAALESWLAGGGDSQEVN